MSVTAVDHFTVLTDDLSATLAFYDEHLNLRPGARPPFTFPGAWLYADGGKGSHPILHIVAGIKKERLVKGVLDHMAFNATGIKEVAAKLKSRGIEYALQQQGETGTWQMFFLDVNGAKVELNFEKDEPGAHELKNR